MHRLWQDQTSQNAQQIHDHQQDPIQNWTGK